MRLLKDTTPLQRGIIRHLILVLDMSEAMLEKDLRPTRYELTLNYACEFVTEYFEQNPISQLGVIGMRDGLAVRISDLSGTFRIEMTLRQGTRMMLSQQYKPKRRKNLSAIHPFRMLWRWLELPYSMSLGVCWSHIKSCSHA